MNLSKIHHIAIIVSDYETAKDFYVNKLGFSVVRENYRPERKDWKLELLGIEHLSEDAAPDDWSTRVIWRPWRNKKMDVSLYY